MNSVVFDNKMICDDLLRSFQIYVILTTENFLRSVSEKNTAYLVEEDFVSMKDTFCKILLFIFELFIHYKHTLLHFLGVDLRAALGVV